MALKLKGSTSGFVGLDAPSVAGNNTLILPENSGSAGQILANDITAGVTTFTQVTVSRNGDLTVPGTISIGGTLTYEDVTSVDSIGIVTARGLSIFGNTTGLQVASGISTFQAITGTTGTFSGDVSIADKIIHTGDANTAIRFPGADQISFETGGVERLIIGVGGAIGIEDVIQHKGDTNTKIRFPANDTITAETGGAERIRIESGGNIGINTDNPNNLLHVYGGQIKAQTSTDDTSTNVDLLRAQCGSTGNALFSVRAANAADDNSNWDIKTNANEDLTFTIGAGSEKLRIASDGKVGIGTDNIHEKLQIQDGHIVIGQNSGDNTNLRNYIKFGRADAPKAAIGFLNDTGNGRGDLIFINSDVSNTSAFTDSDEVMRITHEGDVGINSTAPNTRLDVIESSASRTWTPGNSVVSMFERNGHNRIAIIAGATSYCQIDFGDTNDDNAGYIRYDHSENRMGFRTNAASNEHMIINSSGSVALGVTTARYDDLLQVEGTGGESTIAVIRNSNNTSGAGFFLGKSRTNSVGGNTIVNDDDKLGVISFGGADGTDLASIAAQINGEVDGAVGINSMPGRLVFKTTSDGSAGTSERMRLDSGGRLGVGLEPNTSDVATDVSPGLIQTDGNIDIRYSGTNVDPAGARYLNLINTDTTLVSNQPMGGIHWIGNDSDAPNNINCSFTALNSGSGGASAHFIFKTGGTERMRLSHDGSLRIGNSGSIGQGTNGTIIPGNGILKHSRPVNAGSAVIQVFGNLGRFQTLGDGDAQNTNNTYQGTSDQELKENIVDANSQWNDIKALKVRNYNFKESTKYSTHKQIGVIAQELEVSGMSNLVTSIADELYVEGDEIPEGKNIGDVKEKGYKSVKYSVLYMKSVKALQEAMTRIESLEAEVAALKGS